MKKERIRKIIYGIILVVSCSAICLLFITMLALKYKFTTAKDAPTTEVEDISYIGTIKVISKEKVVNCYNQEVAIQYLGYDTNTKCMYYVYYNYDSVNSTPYMIQDEDGATKQAVYGVDYK